MSLKRMLLAGAALALPVAAQAQPLSGWYVGAGAGLNWMLSTDIEMTGDAMTGLTSAQRKGEVDWNMGYVGVVSVGYGFGNGIRGEAEFSFRYNDVDTVSGFATPSTNFRTGGRVRSYGVMLNALYDFDLGMPFTPYVGAGLGVVMVDYESVERRSNSGPANVAVVPGSDANPAFQAIVGAAYSLGDMVPGLSLTAEYRFMGTTQGEVDAFRRVGSTGGNGQAEKLDNFNHSVLLGIRYAFGAPAPAPVVTPTPAAAPAPARTYLVFFDWDRANLTDRARQIISDAAQASRSVQTTRIEVSGHADRSGSAQYNQRLSQRRADAVAAELERQGVARSSMFVQAFGETRPLVPTADGVREPQNRRVEIILR